MSLRPSPSPIPKKLKIPNPIPQRSHQIPSDFKQTFRMPTFHFRPTSTEDAIALLLFCRRRGIQEVALDFSCDDTTICDIYHDAILTDKITSDEFSELMNPKDKKDFMSMILSSQQEIVDHWRKESYWLSNPADPNSDELWANYMEAKEQLAKIQNFFRDGPVSDRERSASE